MGEKIPEGWAFEGLGKLTELVNMRSERNNQFEPMSSSREGLMKQRDYFKKQVTSSNNTGYKIISYGDFTFRAMSDDGTFKFNRSKFKNKGIVSPAYEVFRSKDCDGDYLSYILDSDIFAQSIYATVQGGTRLALKYKNLQTIRVLIPPLPEQRKIASILTAVDEVIENTQKQIDKLRDLKKATMNELLTKGIGHTEFKDSELGRIPKSWEVKSLGDIAIINRGKFAHRPRNDATFYEGQYPFLQIGDIPIERTKIVAYSQSLNDKGLAVSRLFPKGTLVMTIAATVGEVGILGFDSCFPDSLVGVTVKTNIVENLFLLYLLRMNKDNLIREAPESAQRNLNLDILNHFLLKVPLLKEQSVISSTLFSLDANIEKHQTMKSTTQALKKSLMQDLLTGKVRVKVN